MVEVYEPTTVLLVAAAPLVRERERMQADSGRLFLAIHVDSTRVELEFAGEVLLERLELPLHRLNPVPFSGGGLRAHDLKDKAGCGVRLELLHIGFPGAESDYVFYVRSREHILFLFPASRCE